MRFPFCQNRDSVKNGILISIRRTGDGFHPGLFKQPTVSRFFNRMDEDTLNQFLTIGRILRITYLIGLDDWRYQQITSLFKAPI